MNRRAAASVGWYRSQNRWSLRLEQYFDMGRQATLAFRFPSPQQAAFTSANPAITGVEQIVVMMIREN